MIRPKNSLLASLPINTGEFTIRSMRREDIDEWAAWPMFPIEYDPFNETFARRYASWTSEQRDDFFTKCSAEPDRIVLTSDASEPAISNITLRRIDWNERRIGNMGFIVKPTWCDRGVGTLLMRTVVGWLFDHGFRSIRLDVVGPNIRAQRCYEKVGFIRTGEFWKDEERLRGVDINDPQCDDVRPYLRPGDGLPQIKFYWMELTRDGWRS